MRTDRSVLTRLFPSLVSIVIAASLVQTVLADGGVLDFMRERQNRQYERVPRQVLAFYYTWYGRPERHGHWVHWDKVNPKQHDISASTHYPAKGAYDSHDPEIIDWHIDLAKKHGLTGFITTWWGQGTFDDRAFELLIERARLKDFKVTVYWETAPGKEQAQIDRAVNDLLYVLRKYGSQTPFLKVDGKPVIFVYGRVMNQVPTDSWPKIVRRVQQESGSDFLLIADGYNESYARLFDGVHTYNICGWVKGKAPAELRSASEKSFENAVTLAKRHGRISCLTVIPGYDDTKIRKPGLNAERMGGQTYQVLWEQAIQADPDWVLVTSWNEWHEGSEIEPSWEDDDKYIRMTGEYASRFRSTPHSRVSIPSEQASVDKKSAAELRTLYKGKTIGVLPGYGSEAVFWLADAGVTLKELTWKDLLDPAVFNARRVPLTVYASGEHYVRTVQQDGDVLEALQRYLREGGMIVAIPFQPYPFFYDETGGTNVAAGRVGLPIAGSRPPSRRVDVGPLVHAWEEPPADVELTFHVDANQLPGLPRTAPFPATGDLRWRPATAAVLPEGDVYTPLAQLKDQQGRHYGDGIAFVEHKTGELAGGKTLYIWMRMPDVLGTATTFREVFRFAGRRLSRNQ